MSHQSFVVSRFQYANGTTAWRVDGRLEGLRIRRNFKTQEEALAERSALELKAARLASGRINDVSTFLTLDQVRDAEAAIFDVTRQVARRIQSEWEMVEHPRGRLDRRHPRHQLGLCAKTHCRVAALIHGAGGPRPGCPKIER